MLRQLVTKRVLLASSRFASASSNAATQSSSSSASDKQHTEYYIEKEKKFGAHNYKPLPVVIAKGKGWFIKVEKNFG